MLIANLYVAGSMFFVLASIFMHPHFSGEAHIYLTAISGFIAGSILFSVAAFFTLNASRSNAQSGGGMARVMALLSLAGGLFLLAGSISYLPQFSASYASTGTLLFRAGSFCYISSSALGLMSLLKAVHLERRALQNQRIVLASFICGALLFIAGGFALIEGAMGVGSVVWSLGSVCFLLGSLLSLRRFAPLLSKIQN